MSKSELELYLYKNKLHEETIIDLIDKFSSKTIKFILQDLTEKSIEMKENSDICYIFSDGNCKSNGRKNAKGGYSVYFGEIQPYSNFNKTKQIVSEPTNNKAELSGIRYIYKILNENQELFKDKQIVIITDSQYSISVITKWSEQWIKNGWVNSKKEPVKNKELIQEILEFKNKISKDIKITFKHVFSHTKEPKDKSSIEYFYWFGNEKVDTNINKMLEKI